MTVLSACFSRIGEQLDGFEQMLSRGQEVKLYDSEIEFLQSTGTQCINTGVPTTLPIVVEVDFEFASIAGNNVVFGSVMPSSSYSNRCFLVTSSTGGNYLSLGVSENYINPKTNVWAINSGIRYKANFGFSSTGCSLEINGQTIYSDSTSRSLSTNYNIYVFARNNADTIGSDTYSMIKLYGMKIWTNNHLVRNFIPVRKYIHGHLYDSVTNSLFGNIGSGDFVLGADK